MASWGDPVARASEIKDLPAAAKLADDFANRLYEHPQMPPEDARALEDAIDVLHNRFPELEDPELSQQARLKHQERKQNRKPKTGQKPRQAPARARASRPTPRRSSPGRSRGSSGLGARASRTWGRTGIPGATGSATTFALQIVGITIGLSVLYLLLVNSGRSARGKSAVELIGTGLTRSTHRLIAPVDPIGPRRVPTRRQNQPGRRTGGVAVQP